MFAYYMDFLLRFQFLRDSSCVIKFCMLFFITIYIFFFLFIDLQLTISFSFVPRLNGWLSFLKFLKSLKSLASLVRP